VGRGGFTPLTASGNKKARLEPGFLYLTRDVEKLLLSLLARLIVALLAAFPALANDGH
jgi:hypothetical protein